MARTIGAVLILASCSVTTPRNEALIAGDGALAGDYVDAPSVGAAADGVGPDGVGATPDGSTASIPTDELDGGAASDPGGSASGPRATTPPATSRSTRAGNAQATRTVGITDTEIVVSVSWPFSGAFGPIYENMFETAIMTWVEDVNARGGIHGRRLMVKKVDNLGTVDGQVAACREIQSNGSFVALVEGSISNADADCLDDVGFPALSFLSQARQPAWRSVRTTVSGEAARAVGSFVRGPLGGAGKKVGMIAVQNFPGYREAARDGIRDAGLELVRVESVAPNQASFTSELLRLRGSGAELVVVVTGSEILGILRDARAIDYHPTWTGLPWPADELSIPAGDLMRGIKALRFWTAAESDAAAEYRELAARHGNGRPTSSSVAQYGTVLVLGRALELAGSELDRNTLRAGFDRIENFATGLVPPVTFAAGRIVGSTAQFPLRCCNASREWTSIGPPADRF